MISTVAGGAPPPTPTRALDASIGSVFGIATDSEGALYFSTSLHCVFKLDSSGTLTRIAGNCRSGYSGDGDSAANAQLFTPKVVAADAAHNVYIVDEGNYRIRKVSPGGIISTMAGNGSEGYTGDGGQATDALLFASGIAADSTGNLYISDPRRGRIRKISSDGILALLRVLDSPVSPGTADLRSTRR